MKRVSLTGFLFSCLTLSLGLGAEPVTLPADLAYYEEKVAPILSKHCFSCHSASEGNGKGHLFLDSAEALLRGGKSGPAVIPGNAASSLVAKAVRQETPDLAMPPKYRMAAEEIEIIEKWISDHNAAAPAMVEGTQLPELEVFDLKGRRDSHWCWQPVKVAKAPAASDPRFDGSEIDRWIFASLKERGFQPAERAGKRELIRRLSFDLTGLPPTPGEVAEFVADESAEAYGKLVDRLLASPRFGERWARHWMDLMRYSETYGHEFDYEIHGSWRYRDYLIRSFNQNISYPQLVREHLIGDLLEKPRIDPETGLNESVIGTAALWFADQSHSPVDAKAAELALIDNQIDTITKSFQGLTVSCARCHDHKFDAISQADYYALYGIMQSTHQTYQPLLDPSKLAQATGAVREAAEALQADIAKLPSEHQTLLEAAASGEATKGTQVLWDDPNFLSVPAQAPWQGWAVNGAPIDDLLVKANEYVAVEKGDKLELVQPTRPNLDTRRPGHGAQLIVSSPSFPVKARYVHVLVSGEGAKAQLVLNNFKLIRAPIYGGLEKPINSDKPHWVSFDLKGSWARGDQYSDGANRAYVQLFDIGVQTAAGVGQVAGPRSHFQCYGLLLSDDKAPPAPSLTSGRGEALSKLVQEGKVELPALDQLLSLQRQGMAQTEWLTAAQEGTGWDSPLFVRGDHTAPGDAVPRRFLEAISGSEPAKLAVGESGRRFLCEQILAQDNPLTNRIIVNRLWYHLFGAGIVRTVDNFGLLGELPSHPQLLDAMAIEFAQSGSSIKHMIRTIVMTETYRQSATSDDPKAQKEDPLNRMVYRQNVRRLSAEAIRDSLLSVSGSLDESRYGEPVAVHLTPFMQGRGRPKKSGPLDGANRRSIYQGVRRNFLSSFMLSFDCPAPNTPMGRRNSTNVPTQALILMNDPLVHQLASRFRQRIFKEAGPTLDERLEYAFLQALSRSPSEEEKAAFSEFINQHPDGELEAWSDAAHAIFNLKEFIFIE